MAGPKTSQQHQELSAVERKLLPAATIGMLVDLHVGDAELDNPVQGGAWGTTRTVRAEVLADLLTGTRYTGAGRPRALKLGGARITGSLDLEGATLACPLLLRDCHFDEPVNLSDATAPAIRLPGCHLPALTADQLRTTANLELNHGFAARGEIRLTGAHIGGNLDLSGANLANPGGCALSADLLTVDQSMTCVDRFAAQGEVRLDGAHICGQIDLSGAHLANPGGRALFADGLVVDLRVRCMDGFTACGEVRLPGTRIGGQLNLSGASLTNPGGLALFANRLTVGHSMVCEAGFLAHGAVSLARADIGGILRLTGARLTNPGGVALDLEEAHLAALTLLPTQRPYGVVNLTNARVGRFRDEPDSWPTTFHLRGFVYDTLENEQISVRDRLRWLTLHPGTYTPQLYNQLATAYRRTGQEEAARTVGIAKQWRRRTALNPAGKLLNWLLYVTVGYGYRTWLAGVWLAGLIVVGTWVFSHAYPADITPASTHLGAFDPLAYTLDVLVPVVKLGRQNVWQPQGSALYWSWALTGAGWVLTTAAVAGLTGILRRD
jgi:hypothetical protein